MIINFISKITLFSGLILGSFYVSGQSKIITTGENAISTTDPHAADVVIGSDLGVRHNSSIMMWSAVSASRLWNASDIFYFSLWSTTTPNVALGATVGATSYFNGNVGIGTTTPDAKLSVNGTIHSTAVKVDLEGWSDYVFNPTFKLLPINEVESYIDQNHHLPDMPAEKDVIQNGINLGDMVKLQTKKIEELTLYLIEQQKQINNLKKILENRTPDK